MSEYSKQFDLGWTDLDEMNAASDRAYDEAQAAEQARLIKRGGVATAGTVSKAEPVLVKVKVPGNYEQAWTGNK